MTQKDKQVLLKDLCARFPYGVICRLSAKDVDVSITEKLKIGGLEHFISGTMDVKPYLRPMSSMTGKEKQSYYKLMDNLHFAEGSFYSPDIKDWLDERFFDYRGLIEKGLALEAPEGMYKTE